MSSPTRIRTVKEGSIPIPASTVFSRQSEEYSPNRPSSTLFQSETSTRAMNSSNEKTYQQKQQRFGHTGKSEAQPASHEHDPYGPRPTFKEWWILYWHDFLALLAQAMLSMGLLMWSPLPTSKYFAVTVAPTSSSNGTSGLQPEIYTPSLAYPKRSQFIPISADAILALGVPMLIITLMQIRVRSFWDINNGFWGTIYSVMTACMIQIIIKLIYAGLRPNFLTVCQPVIPSDVVQRTGLGFGKIYFTSSICSNPDKDMVANSMQSFPSGHSAAAFAGLIFGTLYVNGKLKVFANTHTPWFLLLVWWFQPLLAVCIVGSLLLDMSHNWYDILAGAFLGTAMAFTCYRVTFASIWDYRTNHIPLPRVLARRTGWKTGLRLHDPEEVAGWNEIVGIRYGGWGKKDSHML